MWAELSSVPTVFDRGHMVRRLDPVGVMKAPLAWPTRTPITTPIPAPQVHSFNDLKHSVDFIALRLQRRVAKVKTAQTNPSCLSNPFRSKYTSSERILSPSR